MATNSKKGSKTNPAGKKSTAPSKSASKAPGKAVKKAAPKKTISAPPDKKTTEAGKAFDKKIDELAQKSEVVQKPADKKGLPKAGIAAIIVVIIAIIVYLLYPWKKTAIKEQVPPESPAPTQPEIKTVEPQLEAPKQKPEDVNLYKVKYKDQLTEISKQYYGTTREWKRIYEANKDKIKNPNLIFPGQELVIPKDEKKDK